MCLWLVSNNKSSQVQIIQRILYLLPLPPTMQYAPLVSATQPASTEEPATIDHYHHVAHFVRFSRRPTCVSYTEINQQTTRNQHRTSTAIIRISGLQAVHARHADGVFCPLRCISAVLRLRNPTCHRYEDSDALRASRQCKIITFVGTNFMFDASIMHQVEQLS